MEQIESLEVAPGGWKRIDVIVIGGGQAGLSVSYHLAQRRVPHVVLDASENIGDAWRSRWSSLRLFTPARYDGLDGMPFPGDKGGFPTKVEMADYLQTYAKRFRLPVLSGMRVDSLFRDGDDYIATCGARIFIAHQVVVAMSNFQHARIPAFADQLSSDIRQLTAAEYRDPGQLTAGATLIVGAGNSGAEIAKDLVEGHSIMLAGTSPGESPFAQTSFLSRHVFVHVLNGLVFPRILSVNTKIGRRMRPGFLKHGVPLIRVRSRDLTALGVRRVGRVVGAVDGLPLLDDGSTLAVANIVWCTGFTAGFSWIRLPVFDEAGEPLHEQGVVESAPGLYFVGLHFLTSVSSAMVHGVGTDAERIAGLVAQNIGVAAAV